MNLPDQGCFSSSSHLWQLQQRRNTGQLLLRGRRSGSIGDLAGL
jgi:hypothetical protein